ncbi:hypothetical protein [Sorlinia euscelidii]|uniref:hypothetical protein n=1 Tax=Sorlinia euscelidii TaxID=3081148 RepID=UPI00374E0871
MVRTVRTSVRISVTRIGTSFLSNCLVCVIAINMPFSKDENAVSNAIALKARIASNSGASFLASPFI